MTNDRQAAHPQDDPKQVSVTFGEFLKLGGDHSQRGDLKDSDYLGKKMLAIIKYWKRRGVTRALAAAVTEPMDLLQNALVRMVEDLQRTYPTVASVMDVSLPISEFERYFHQHVNYALKTHNAYMRAKKRSAETQSLDDPDHPVVLPSYDRSSDGGGLSKVEEETILAEFGAALEPGRLKDVFACLVNNEGSGETDGEMAARIGLTAVQFSRAKHKLMKRFMARVGHGLPDRKST